MFSLFFKFLLTCLFCIVLWIFFDTVYHFKKYPKKHAFPVIFKPYPWWYNLLIRFPEMLGKELARKDPNEFSDTGFILFEGKQGAGKTCAMTHYLCTLKAKYPEMYITSNYGLIFQDSELTHWRDIVGKKNGTLGFACAFDEISIWFNNRNFKNFDPAFFSTIVQNRKQKRLILGTAQNISLCDKALRTQVTQLRQCYCFLGFIVLVRKFSPTFDSEGNISKLKPRGFYVFMQDDFLRECYDTYTVIDKMKEVGYDEKFNY